MPYFHIIEDIIVDEIKNYWIGFNLFFKTGKATKYKELSIYYLPGPFTIEP